MNGHIKRLFEIIEKYEFPDYLLARPGEEVVEIEEPTSRAAKYYEKVRQAVEYKDESLIKRSLVERTIKRKTAFGAKLENIADEIVFNLIQAGYIQNEVLSKNAVKKVHASLEKMSFLSSVVKEKDPTLKNVIYESKIIGIASCEIEDILFPKNQKRLVADTFYNVIKDRVDIASYDISQHELDIQIYLACHKGLLKSDETRLFYQLLLVHYPEWAAFDIENDGNNIEEIGNNFFHIKEAFGAHINHSIQPKILAKLKNDIVYFTAIMGLLEKHGRESRVMFENSETLSSEVKSFLEEKYSQRSASINKMAIRAIFYIFATKIILAFAIEMPYDIFFEDGVNYLPLSVNVLFHPILLFLITRSIYVGDARNTNLVIGGISNLFYGEHKPIRFKIRGNNTIVFYVASLAYALVFLSLFASIIFLLTSMQFNFVGVILFILFISLVSFLGIRIRMMAKMWVVQSKEKGIISFLRNLLTLPIISFGMWLSRKFSSINIFVFVMDFIIETPFKALLKIVDSFVSYVREKKEEIY